MRMLEPGNVHDPSRPVCRGRAAGNHAAMPGAGPAGDEHRAILGGARGSSTTSPVATCPVVHWSAPRRRPTRDDLQPRPRGARRAPPSAAMPKQPGRPEEVPVSLPDGLARTVTALEEAGVTGASGTLRLPKGARAKDSSAPLPRLSLHGEAAEFEVRGLLGEGGMGIVELAAQTALGRDVALERVRPERKGDRAAASLVAEARLTGALEHPNVVPVHALGRDDAGAPVLVMKPSRGRHGASSCATPRTRDFPRGPTTGCAFTSRPWPPCVARPARDEAAPAPSTHDSPGVRSHPPTRACAEDFAGVNPASTELPCLTRRRVMVCDQGQ